MNLHINYSGQLKLITIEDIPLEFLKLKKYKLNADEYQYCTNSINLYFSLFEKMQK